MLLGRRGFLPGFTPASLFTGGVQGVWYDPSNFSTLFQDSAGTTPVTAVEQPVGRMLDLSGNNNHATQSTSAARPVLSARVNLLLATTTLATQSVVTVATGYTLRFTGPGSIVLSGTATGTYSAGAYSVTCTAGTLTLTVSGVVSDADLRPTNDGVGLPVYQRVNTSTDYDTTGFPLYLRFDGTDDSMATGAITTGVDKVQVFAGVRKLSDGSFGVVSEFGNLSPQIGTFTVHAPATPSASSYMFASRGTFNRAIETPSNFPIPITNVLTGLGDISGDVCMIRVNGLVQGNNTADQGTGNYGNYQLYIGSRAAGPTQVFNGRIYPLIVRFGANLSAQQISDTETWVNGKTKAY